MLSELARRLKEQGRAAGDLRTELARVGATKEEIDVVLGSLGFGVWLRKAVGTSGCASCSTRACLGFEAGGLTSG